MKRMFSLAAALLLLASATACKGTPEAAETPAAESASAVQTAAPEVATPAPTTPEAATPEAATPETATPEAATPEAGATPGPVNVVALPTIELEGGSAQGEAVSFALGQKIACGAYISRQWYTFTTTDSNQYLVNLLPSGDDLDGSVEILDGSGDSILKKWVESNGSVSEYTVTLEPNTPYYLAVQRPYDGVARNISFVIQATGPDTLDGPATDSSGALTVVSQDGLANAGGENGLIYGGTNQNDARLLPLNTKLYGKTDPQYPDGLWYAFTTGSQQGATYKFTMIHKSLGDDRICLNVFNRDGKEISRDTLYATDNGIASTMSLELDPNTTYYARIYNRDKEAKSTYCLIIRDPDAQQVGYATSDSLIESVNDAGTQKISAATNMDDASLIPLNTQLSGNVTDGKGFIFAFTTNGVEGSPYKFTLVNMTPKSSDLQFDVYDRYGASQYAPDTGPAADQDGKASTTELELEPNTTYYARLHARSGDDIAYTLEIQAPKDTQATASENDLVFEVPFELNSTQVMFVANKAQFLNEGDAKAALQPVADVILAHPDHPILLAGTTATDGTQEQCVALSQQRADAVKNLLVSAFGVPASQLQTAGLGYEKDPFTRGQDIDVNGNFVESEAAKNRRVVVLDANDPIAQQILNP